MTRGAACQMTQLICYTPRYRVAAVVVGPASSIAMVSEQQQLHGASGPSLSAAEWQRLVAGDRVVFRRVYEAYVGLLRYVAGRLGLRGEEADEVVQESFLRLHQRAGEIKDAAKLKSWLVANVRNQAIDRLRTRKRHATPVGAEELENVGAPLWAAHVDAHQELELGLVRELLERLAGTPGGETLKLFYVDGLSAKEIATRNGEAISTVTTRLSRLREKFGDELRRHVQALRNQR